MDMETKSFEAKMRANLAGKLSAYIPAILDKYSPYMSDRTIARLQNLIDKGDYEKVIAFDTSGCVTAYANHTNITMPIGALPAFEKLKQLPGAGSQPEHKCYTPETIIENDNTLEDYIQHMLLIGGDFPTYCNDILLHETMHYCGSGGSNTMGAGAFREGLNEYLTRVVAKENGFQTSACGYPKEIKVVLAMEKILGADVLTQIAFLNDLDQINAFLLETVGREKTKLFNSVVSEMENQFHEEYLSKQSEYVGFQGAINKAKQYKNLDYTKALDMIAAFNNLTPDCE